MLYLAPGRILPGDDFSVLDEFGQVAVLDEFYELRGTNRNDRWCM